MKRAGDRIRAIREVLNLTQSEFADEIGVPYVRLRNCESQGVFVTEKEFSAICTILPEVSEFLTHGGNLSIPRLMRSNSERAIQLGKRLGAGVRPKCMHINSYIIDEP